MKKYSKIVIVNCRSKEVRYVPLYELFVAEALKKNNLADKVEVYTIMKGESVEKYLPCWKDADFVLFWEYYGIKAPYHVKLYFDLAKTVKEECNVEVFFGGYWATAYGKYFKEFGVFDNVFEGYSIDELVKAVSEGITGRERIIKIHGDSNFEKYPLNLSYLRTPQKYVFIGMLYGYISSFSCPRNCKFCNANSAKNIGSGFVARSIDMVKKDIDALVDFFKFDRIVIKDLNFFFDVDRAVEILDYINKKDKKVTIYLDVTLYDIDESFLNKLIKTGIDDLYFGLESFDEDTRKILGKPYTDDKLEEVFGLAESRKINLTGNLIVGLPWQSKEDVERTIEKTIYYMNRYEHVFITINCYKPEYGTELQQIYFKDLHEKIGFKELVDIYLGKVRKHQSIIYGNKFDFIDIERLSCMNRLINAVKVTEQVCPRVFVGMFKAIRRLMEKNLNASFLESPLWAPFLNPESVKFIRRYILNLFSLPFMKRVVQNVFGGNS